MLRSISLTPTWSPCEIASGLLALPTAIHVNGLAGQVARLVRAKEGHGGTNLPAIAGAAQGDLSQHHLPGTGDVANPGGHVSLKITGVDCVNPDPERGH